jgi:predicted nicotinamide N-methyase
MSIPATADAATVLRSSIEQDVRRLRGPAAPAPPPALLDLEVEELALPGGGLFVVHPRDWGDLREEEALAKRPVPYWAIMWPSGRCLAAALDDEELAGRRVLEIGCGLALPSAVAARRGARVLATDGSADAVAFAAHVLALNELTGETAVVDWTHDADALGAQGPFDLVLAADVLYTEANVRAALQLLPRVVAPGGTILLADPGRTGAKSFLTTARKLWRLRSEDRGSVRIHRLTALRPPIAS